MCIIPHSWHAYSSSVKDHYSVFWETECTLPGSRIYCWDEATKIYIATSCYETLLYWYRYTEREKEKNICTCGVVFIHWPAVNLKCCIATIPGKAYYMVFAIIYRCAFLFNRDVHCANIEDYTNLALLLKEEKKQMLLNCWHSGERSWPTSL